MASTPSRRTALRTAGAGAASIVVVGAVASCGTTTDSASSTPATGGAGQSGAAASSAGGASPVKKADIPVGGGKVVGQVVVTQPVAGTFKAFSAVCTHQGCLVTAVSSGQIMCPCHGSSFDAATGAVVSGPARSPLPAKTVTVAGDTLTLG
jgi:Rieske Fe-S protein